MKLYLFYTTVGDTSPNLSSPNLCDQFFGYLSGSFQPVNSFMGLLVFKTAEKEEINQNQCFSMPQMRLKQENTKPDAILH